MYLKLRYLANNRLKLIDEMIFYLRSKTDDLYKSKYEKDINTYLNVLFNEILIDLDKRFRKLNNINEDIKNTNKRYNDLYPKQMFIKVNPTNKKIEKLSSDVEDLENLSEETKTEKNDHRKQLNRLLNKGKKS